MNIQVGDKLKHFKGKNLTEKNIYEVILIDVTYTGDTENISQLVIYKPLFQNSNKIFAREYSSLIEELSIEQQQLYNQIHRVELLSKEELLEIETPEFINNKKNYYKSKEN